MKNNTITKQTDTEYLAKQKLLKLKKLKNNNSYIGIFWTQLYTCILQLKSDDTIMLKLGCRKYFAEWYRHKYLD